MDIITVTLGEFETLEVFPLADVHIGDPKTDEGLFSRFTAYVLQKPNRYLLIDGDLINNAITTSVSNTYNEKMSPNKQKYIMTDYLKPLKERILCMVPGNHEERSTKAVDNNIVEDIAYNIGCMDKYKENGAYVNLRFGKDRHLHKISYSFYVVHGAGGGKRAGTPLNTLEMLPLTVQADIYIMGHVHRRAGFKNTYFKPTGHWDRLEQCERAFVVASPWQDFGGYAQRKLYTPTVKGAKPLILSGKDKNVDIVL